MKKIIDIRIQSKTIDATAPTVYLIGAGPGANDLITVRGAQILGKANIVFYDALIDSEMLQWCPQAKLIEVGKRCGRFSTAQQFINQQLIHAAKNYPIVVRLKGGDPLIFGRATEEMNALDEAGIEFEVVPGITTALAACATLKQAPTSRNISRSIKITTLPSRLDYQEIQTQIFYMGREQLAGIAEQLIGEGYSLETPVCLTASVSLPEQIVHRTNLGQLIHANPNELFPNNNPVLVLIGEVFRLHKKNASTLTDQLESFPPEINPFYKLAI